MTVYVAKEIGKLPAAKYITLENSAVGAVEDAGAKGQGRLHPKIRANGRFDILLWWGNETPRAPIEVKLQVLSFKKISADVERIAKVVKRKSEQSTIGFGAVVFCASCKDNRKFKAKARLTQSLKKILQESKKNLVGDSCLISLSQTQIKTVGDSAWVGAVLLLKPKNS